MATATPERVLLSEYRHRPDRYAEVVSAGRWKRYDHLKYIGLRIARACNAGNGRLIINMPPRLGKSELISHWTPTWFLDDDPSKRIILASYGSELAVNYGRLVRNEAATNPRVRNLRLTEDSKAAGKWNTPHGGGMLCVGVGGAATGFGADLLLIDDPYKGWLDAWSTNTRRSVREWFDGTAYQRMEPGGTIIVLHTRWHPKDLTGYLVEEHSDDWEVIRLPHEAEANDPLDRAVGAPLCPERYGYDDLARIKAASGPAKWESMHQQNPGAASAGVAYDHFGAANLDPSLTLRADLPLCVSFDFNINPGMHALVGHYDPKSDRFGVVHELHGHRWHLERCIDELGKLVKAQAWRASPELWVFGDASGGGASTNDGRTSYQIVRQRCAAFTASIRLRVPAANPGIKDSLDTTNDALSDQHGGKHVLIHPRCERLIADCREVQRDEDGLIDKTDPLLTHASDCLRYWVTYLRPLGGRRDRIGGRLSVV